MAYTYQELKRKTIQELREIAKGVEAHEAVQGYSQMNKDHLLPALCKALGVDAREHRAAAGELNQRVRSGHHEARRHSKRGNETKRDEAGLHGEGRNETRFHGERQHEAR